MNNFSDLILAIFSSIVETIVKTIHIGYDIDKEDIKFLISQQRMKI